MYKEKNATDIISTAFMFLFYCLFSTFSDSIDFP